MNDEHTPDENRPRRPRTPWESPSGPRAPGFGAGRGPEAGPPESEAPEPPRRAADDQRHPQFGGPQAGAPQVGGPQTSGPQQGGPRFGGPAAGPERRGPAGGGRGDRGDRGDHGRADVPPPPVAPGWNRPDAPAHPAPPSGPEARPAPGYGPAEYRGAPDQGRAPQRAAGPGRGDLPRYGDAAGPGEAPRYGDGPGHSEARHGSGAGGGPGRGAAPGHAGAPGGGDDQNRQRPGGPGAYPNGPGAYPGGQGPQFGRPRFDNPRFGDAQVSDPQFGNPQVGNRQFGDPEGGRFGAAGHGAPPPPPGGYPGGFAEAPGAQGAQRAPGALRAPGPWGGVAEPERPGAGLRAGAVLKESIATVRRDPVTALVTSLVFFVLVWAVQQLANLVHPPAGLGWSVVNERATSTVVVDPYLLCSWPATCLLAGLLAPAVLRRVRGEPAAPRAAWSATLRRLPALLGLAVVWLVALAVLWLPFLLVDALLKSAVGPYDSVDKVTGIAFGTAVVGFVYLIVAVFATVPFACAYPLVALEEIGPVAAMRRSVALTRGAHGRVFAALALPALLVAVAAGAVNLVIGLVLILAGVARDPAPGIGLAVVATVVTVIAATLLQPVASAAATHVTLHLLRARGEDLPALPEPARAGGDAALGDDVFGPGPGGAAAGGERVGDPAGEAERAADGTDGLAPGGAAADGGPFAAGPDARPTTGVHGDYDDGDRGHHGSAGPEASAFAETPLGSEDVTSDARTGATRARRPAAPESEVGSPWARPATDDAPTQAAPWADPATADSPTVMASRVEPAPVDRSPGAWDRPTAPADGEGEAVATDDDRVAEARHAEAEEHPTVPAAEGEAASSGAERDVEARDAEAPVAEPIEAPVAGPEAPIAEAPITEAPVTEPPFEAPTAEDPRFAPPRDAAPHADTDEDTPTEWARPGDETPAPQAPPEDEALVGATDADDGDDAAEGREAQRPETVPAPPAFGGPAEPAWAPEPARPARRDNDPYDPRWDAELGRPER